MGQLWVRDNNIGNDGNKKNVRKITMLEIIMLFVWIYYLIMIKKSSYKKRKFALSSWVLGGCL